MELDADSTVSGIAAVTAVASAVAGVSSALTALLAIRLQKRWGATDVFIRIAEQLENPELRKHRRVVYSIDRNAFETWTPEQTASVDAWCAHLDLVSVLAQSRQVDKVAFLNLYGDVVLRTIYQVAPYCNHQVEIRGSQFLLPLRLLTGDLVRLWRKRSRRHYYPTIIGFPTQPSVRLSPDVFDNDEAVRAFRVDRRLSENGFMPFVAVKLK